MKELSIEQKAKRYDEALAMAKECITYIPDEAVNKYMLNMFPELKESEDEKMCKVIYNAIKYLETELSWDFLDDVDILDVYAWLEKQSNKSQGKSALEAIKEKKIDNANGVEPKFKVGDWISTTLQIVNVDINKELYWFNDGSYLPFTDEEYLHLWTIKNAKDGDVLSYVTDEGDLWIMIYWSLYEPYEGHVHYHVLLINDNFTNKGTCCICIDNLRPATKEQRELLFQKIKESGYEWLADKKDLIKL